MTGRASPRTIGLFVLAGLGLAVASVVVFGSGAFEPEPFMVETYFDTSVTGLEVGGKVLLRGCREREESYIYR